MKVAAITKQGRRRGVIVELDSKTKVLGALKDAIVSFSEENKSGKFMNFVREVEPAKIDIQVRGKPLKGKYTNNNYISSGSCVVHFRDRATGKVRPSKIMKFYITFHDALDRYGLPDLEVREYKFH